MITFPFVWGYLVGSLVLIEGSTYCNERVIIALSWPLLYTSTSILLLREFSP